MADKLIEIPQKPEHIVSLRPDIRPPELVFGRCAVTGEWGPCITIDLGNISIDAPVITEQVDYDPDTKAVVFNKWEPVIFQQNLTVSRNGLAMLMNYLDSQENPIPAITPNLVYKFQIMHRDGSIVSQFEYDENGKESESDTKGVDWARVKEIRIVARYTDESQLPTYIFNCETGKFYQNGQEIDTYYEKAMPEGAIPFYARDTHLTFGSILKPNSLNRQIEVGSASVIQCLGWETKEARCIIGVDERGAWRPWKYEGDK
jgi:hypothetical protein